MSSSSSSSLPLAIRDILDKIGSEDSFFPTETPDFLLPGTSTPESAALEHSLRSLVARFQDLEQRALHSPDMRPVVAVGRQVQNVKDDGTARLGVCSSCGHRLNSFGVPHTPDETPPVVENVYPAKSMYYRIICWALRGLGLNGYDSSASETVPVTARNPSADSTVSASFGSS